jgi:transcriptional regulator with XRE-family HTH domain
MQAEKRRRRSSVQPAVRPLGDQIKEWRRRRRLSQMDLALDAEISTRHLSFIETGRSRPSREMVLRLADQLALPLRERNAMLLAAGFAPLYAERALDDPALAAARRAVAIDRHWHLIAANAAIKPLLAGCAAHLLEGPINVLRLSLHPEGLAPRILNLAEWRAHLLERLRRQAMTTGDSGLEALVAELEAYPFPDGAGQAEDMGGFAIPLRLATPLGELSLISTTTVFGTPLDVTLDELAIEAFYPADAITGERLRGLSGG